MTKGNWITLGIGTLLVGGLWWGYRQVNLLYQYALKIKSVSVGEISSKKLEVTLHVEFTNKSSLKFDVNGYSLDVYINGIFISKIASTQKQLVPGDGKAVLNIPIALSIENIIMGNNLLRIVAAIANLKTAVLKISGTASVKSGILNASNAPIEFSETLANLIKPKPKV